jgi:hypothetical protein
MSLGRGEADSGGSAALREIRRVRRQRYVEHLDVMEVLYRVYVVAIVSVLALGVLAGVLDEAPATPSAVAWLRDEGPALIGIAVAVAVFAGLRTGARGGPLAIEAAEVQYVLLAPVDRGAALRPLAVRQLRVAVLSGGAIGAVIGNFVFRRLPGSPVEWIGGLALFGALLPVCGLGAALFASGRRLSPRVAVVTGLLLIAWSGADVALGTTTSPATMLGELATLALQSGVTVVLAALGTALALALVTAALLGVGGILLEAARRRAALAAELRFSLTVQDLRTVVLLRRQLASERPRRHPWLRLPKSAGRHPVWRRGWQSFLRWPPARIGRAALFGVASGALAAGAWSAAPLALPLPGLILFVAALDLIEPLAQESDRPTRRQLLPVAPGSLIRRQLAAPSAATAIVLLIATATAALVGGGATALEVGLVACAPLAVGLACCAAFSATSDPYAYLFVPQLGYVVAAAPAVAAALLVGSPLLSAYAAGRQGLAAAPAAISASIWVALIVAGAMPFLSRRFNRREEVSA